MATDDQDRLRTHIAWIVTGVWVLCFPLAALVPGFPITWAQAPMMAVAGWLFAVPLIRKNGAS